MAGANITELLEKVRFDCEWNVSNLRRNLV
jgi:hypothetical protein